MKKLMSITAMTVPLFLLIFVALACSKENNTEPARLSEPKDSSSAASSKSLTYLALGDSYTIGQSVQESERFPAQTAALLATDNVTIKSIKYIASTGWTTTNLKNAIAVQNITPGFDIVTLLIGVNDQYQRRDTTGYRANFTSLLTTAINLAGNRRSRVFVLSIPDYSTTPFVAETEKAIVSEEINAFNAINEEVTVANKITYIDITPASREATVDPTLIASDRLHPSGRQYAKWASLLATAIKNAVR